jgi:hypothetical protein
VDAPINEPALFLRRLCRRRGLHQFQDGGEGRDVASVLQNAHVGRRDAGALREFLPRPAALLAQLFHNRYEAFRVRIEPLPTGIRA